MNVYSEHHSDLAEISRSGLAIAGCKRLLKGNNILGAGQATGAAQHTIFQFLSL
jgi:hypothetical protein